MKDVLQYANPRLRRCLQGYIGLRNQMSAKGKLTELDAFLCDSFQQPNARPHCGKRLGCLTTHGFWWSLCMGRPLLGMERFLAQGLDVFSKRSPGELTTSLGREAAGTSATPR